MSRCRLHARFLIHSLAYYLAYFLTAAAVLGASPLAWADKKEDLQTLRAKIERLQKDLSSAESSRSEAADALKASEKAISEVNRGIHELSKEQLALNASLKDINRRSQAAAAEVANQQLLQGRLIRHQYMHGSTDGLRLMLEGRDVAAVNRQIHYYGYIAKLRTSIIRRTQESLQQLEALQSEALKEKNALNDNEAEQKHARKKLEAEKQARRKMLNRIAGAINKSRSEIGRLKRDEDRLAKLVAQIGKVLSAKPADRKRKPGQTVEEVADGSFIGKAFQALKGKLKLPLRGEISSKFGSQREEGGATWKGLFIRAESGRPTRQAGHRLDVHHKP